MDDNAFLWMWFLSNQNRQYTDCNHQEIVDLVYALASEVQDLKSQLNGGNPHFGTITCKEWQVVDNDGEMRIIAWTSADGLASVQWNDTDGKMRISASTLADGSANVQWNDTDGKARINAATSADGSANVQWNDTDGKLRIDAATLADGDAWVVWFDKDGKARIVAATSADGTVELPTEDTK